MELINNYLTPIGIPTLLGLLGVLLKIGLDTFNMTGIERKLMTDSEKVTALFSKAMLLSIFATALISPFLLYNTDASSSDFNKLVILLLALIMFVIPIVLFMTIYVLLLEYFISIKVEYKIKKGGEKWDIDRRIDREKILISLDGFQKIVNTEYIMNTNIISYINDSKVEKYSWFYLDNFKGIVIKIFVAVTLLLYLFFNQDTIRIRFVLLILLLVYSIIMHSVVAYSNRKVKENWEEIQKEIVDSKDKKE